jgi:hypothetical protein
LCDNVVIGDNNKCRFSAVPTASSTIQPTCGTPSGTIVFDSNRSGVQFEWYNVSVLEYVLRLAPNDYTLYVRNTTDATCVLYHLATTINTVPLPPAVPTASATVQPTCATPSGTITITTQSGVEYSVNGTAYQSSNSFDSRLILLYVRNLTDPSCVTISGSTTSINSTPPVVPTTASVTQPTCAVQSKY